MLSNTTAGMRGLGSFLIMSSCFWVSLSEQGLVFPWKQCGKGIPQAFLRDMGRGRLEQRLQLSSRLWAQRRGFANTAALEAAALAGLQDAKVLYLGVHHAEAKCQVSD